MDTKRWYKSYVKDYKWKNERMDQKIVEMYELRMEGGWIGKVFQKEYCFIQNSGLEQLQLFYFSD